MYSLPHHFSSRLTIPLLIFLAMILMVMLVAQDVLAGQTFTVTNTHDSGSGSLRQAILEANTTPGLDVIAFNISSINSGPYTIQPTSPLPQITDPVIIDGYTQPGAAPATDDDQATLLIELDGMKAGEGSVSGLIITAGNSTVRGLAINRFGDVGIHIQEKGGNIIEGNYIGTDVTGTVDRGNADDGIRIWSAPGNTIGGATAEARNIISGNNDMGVEIILSGATRNMVLGNYIGTDVTGTAGLGNSTHGVFINASGNVIGDSSSGTGNVISGNGSNGITIHEIGATGNRISGNFIGTDVTGTVDLGNSTDGVLIRSASNNTIGGTTAESRNVISGNNVRGISIQGGVDTGGVDATGNLVQGNLIGTDVTGTAALGNTQDGVQIRGAANNTIGGTMAGARNIISGNNTGGGWGGVSIINHPTLLITGASGNLVQGNFIGTDVTGTAALGNGSVGVVIEAAGNNTLTDNTVSNNRYGIRLQSSSSDNQIYNNNFIDNTTQAYGDINRGGNIFNLEKPIGGNYWSDWTTPDADVDGFVDSPYVFNGGVDYLPWAHQNGWLPPRMLAEAMDTDLSFTTGGSAEWLYQIAISYNDGDAAQSGDISYNQESWMQTSVAGPTMVTFYWKVSSEADYDFLEFYIDGSLKDRISGSVDWQQKMYTITTSGSHTLEWRYVKDKGIDSGSDCGWVDKLEYVPIPPPPPDPLAEALDTDLSFSTGGDADWLSQTVISYYDSDAAKSGYISHNQESWLQTTVSGAGMLSFYWKVSSEERFDFLEFYIDDSLQDKISGSVDWHLMTYEITDSNLHTLEWRYAKDYNRDRGSDCGWLDKVDWMSAP